MCSNIENWECDVDIELIMIMIIVIELNPETKIHTYF